MNVVFLCKGVPEEDAHEVHITAHEFEDLFERLGLPLARSGEWNNAQLHRIQEDLHQLVSAVEDQLEALPARKRNTKAARELFYVGSRTERIAGVVESAQRLGCPVSWG